MTIMKPPLYVEKLKHYIDIDRIFTEIDTFVLSEDQFQDQLNDEYLSLQICLQGIDEEMDPYFGSRRMHTDFSEEDLKDNRGGGFGSTGKGI